MVEAAEALKDGVAWQQMTWVQQKKAFWEEKAAGSVHEMLTCSSLIRRCGYTAADVRGRCRRSKMATTRTKKGEAAELHGKIKPEGLVLMKKEGETKMGKPAQGQ